ncbi:MAG: HNH endonuclease [Opitutales bacterium]
MLLALLEMLDAGKVRENAFPFDDRLRDAFADYFRLVRRRDDKPTIENPFFYLQSDGIWTVATVNGPLRAQASVGRLREWRAVGSVDAETWLMFQSQLHREQIREAIIARFFWAQRVELRALINERLRRTAPADPFPAGALEAAEPAVAFRARSSAFRKTVIDIYDYQCAACGLRIKLPDPAEPRPVTFVDAAHLIPFREGGEAANDHPSNGLALCKNHHWAMDKHLIAPSTDFTWRVSPLLIANRSTGEASLLDLSGKPVLPPHDPKFCPTHEALRWREERLRA